VTAPAEDKLRSSLLSIYFCTVVTLCSLYAAQPIQPVFQAEFNLSSFQAILFTTLMMAPLGFAPLFYGVLLEAFPVRRILRSALFMLGLLELLFAVTDSYLPLLLIRGLQGFAIPAILTSLMSYISFTSPIAQVQSAIARYIGATIIGGFLGRFLSGLFTDLFGWRFFFVVLGFLLLFGWYQLRKLEAEANITYSKPRLSEVYHLVRQRTFLWLYLAIFGVFFVFAALLNFLPFAVKAIDPSFRETGIGVMYAGYVMGVLVSLNVRRIISYFGSETKAVTAGLIVYIIGAVGFMANSYEAMFAAMFVFCTGMFTAHSILSGYVNALAKTRKGIANGVYISFYYLGGTFGSFAPGAIYGLYGCNPFVCSLILVLFVVLICIRQLHLAVKKSALQDGKYKTV